MIMEEEEFAECMRLGRELTLTDAYAPVDQLISMLHDDWGQ